MRSRALPPGTPRPAPIRTAAKTTRFARPARAASPSSAGVRTGTPAMSRRPAPPPGTGLRSSTTIPAGPCATCRGSASAPPPASPTATRLSDRPRLPAHPPEFDGRGELLVHRLPARHPGPAGQGETCAGDDDCQPGFDCSRTDLVCRRICQPGGRPTCPGETTCLACDPPAILGGVEYGTCNGFSGPGRRSPRTKGRRSPDS